MDASDIYYLVQHGLNWALSGVIERLQQADPVNQMFYHVADVLQQISNLLA